MHLLIYYDNITYIYLHCSEICDLINNFSFDHVENILEINNFHRLTSVLIHLCNVVYYYYLPR
jgi:hypothetical protein